MIARDIFGSKQIFYQTDRKDYFGNLTDAVVNKGFKDYSKEGISSFLSFRYPILDHTMFAGYQQVDTGVKISADGSREVYWRPKLVREEVGLDEAIAEVERLLIKSIDKLIGKKKRIGITLSGGLDSSLLLAMVKKHFPDREVYTYSCGFYGEDEFEYSRQMAEEFSDKHREFVLGREDFLGQDSILNALIKQKAAPLHPNELCLAYIEMKARLDLCDIVLCGEGADDIFGGYGKNLRMYLNYEGQLEPFYKYFMRNYRYFNNEEVARLIRPEYIIDDLELIARVFNEDECPEDIRDQVFYFKQRVHVRGLIERGTNALRFSAFAPAFPFADRELVDYANSLDFNYKVRWHDGYDESRLVGMSYKDVSEKYDTPKYILKKLAENYLPENIIYRPKYGFPVPFEQWLNDINEYDFNLGVFKSKDISYLNGWKKFMLINLNRFIQIFEPYKL